MKGFHLKCWLLGLGSLVAWNSMLTVMDYYTQLFPDYHPSRVLTLVYQPFAVITAGVLVLYEAKVDTRIRTLLGFALFFVATLVVPVLDLVTSGHGGLGPFLGVCVLSAAFGLASAFVEGALIGQLAHIDPSSIQSFSAGLGASGAVTSGLRLITKASFPETKHGLRKGAIAFFFASAFIELLCLVTYASSFATPTKVKANGEVVKVPNEDATEESKLQTAQSTPARHLLKQNLDYAFDLFAIFTLTLSIFPGFLAEDTGTHGLRTWYIVVLIAMCNFGDLIGRYLPLIKALKLESRTGLVVAVLLRYLFIPAFYVTAKYGDQGWMILLCILLGVTNGHLTVCVLTSAPSRYTGADQKALGSILVFFLLGGTFAGVTLDWLWLIGKGW